MTPQHKLKRIIRALPPTLNGEPVEDMLKRMHDAPNESQSVRPIPDFTSLNTPDLQQGQVLVRRRGGQGLISSSPVQDSGDAYAPRQWPASITRSQLDPSLGGVVTRDKKSGRLIAAPMLDHAPSIVPVADVQPSDTALLTRPRVVGMPQPPITPVAQPDMNQQASMSPVIRRIEPPLSSPVSNIPAMEDVRRLSPPVEVPIARPVDPSAVTRSQMVGAPPPLVAAMPDPAAITRTPAVQPIAAPQSTDMLGDINRRIHEREARPIADHNGRWKSGLITMERDALEGLEHGGIGGALGGALGGLATGVIAPASDERWAKQHDVGKLNQEFGNEAQRQGAVGKLEDDAVNRDWRRAQITDISSKPQEREAEFNRKLARDRQSANKENLKLLSGIQVDSNNATQVALLSNFGITPEQWNNSRSNLVSGKEVDPENPTQTRNVLVNKVTGETTPLGQAGYVEPVNAEGLKSSLIYTQNEQDKRHADDVRARRAEGAANRQTRVQVAGMRGGGRADGRTQWYEDRFVRAKDLIYSDPKRAAKHRAEAISIAGVLSSNYGYEAGQDADGNPYIKPPAQSAPELPSGAVRRPSTPMKQASMGDIQDYADKRKISVEQARREFASHGYQIQ
jgi:hypothetical protein